MKLSAVCRILCFIPIYEVLQNPQTEKIIKNLSLQFLITIRIIIMILIVIRLKPIFEVELFYKYKCRSHWKGEREHLTPVIGLQEREIIFCLYGSY